MDLMNPPTKYFPLWNSEYIEKKIMKRFFITEEEKKNILGLYELDDKKKEFLDPESINNFFSVELWIPESIANIDNQDTLKLLETKLGEIAGEYEVKISRKTSADTDNYLFVMFDVAAKNKDTMKHSDWLYTFSNEARQEIIDLYRNKQTDVKVNEPNFLWSKQIPNDPSSTPDKCVGVRFFIIIW